MGITKLLNPLRRLLRPAVLSVISGALALGAVSMDAQAKDKFVFANNDRDRDFVTIRVRQLVLHSVFLSEIGLGAESFAS